MKINKLKNSPYLIFAPFLIIYICVVVVVHKNVMEGDEGRYIQFAKNIIQGFYSPRGADLDLWNGPGYPLFLVPFLLARLPLISIVIANCFLQYFSLILLFKTIARVSNTKIAIVITIFWGCYFNFFRDMAMILTESLTIFLITGLAYLIIAKSVQRRSSNLVLIGIVLGILALTKIIFGYVIVMMCILLFLRIIFFREKKVYINYLIICLIAVSTTCPYLYYTYNLSGRIFYWGNSGGMSLYWMSTPYENEYGDWKNIDLTTEYTNGSYISHQSDSILQRNHAAEYKRAFQYTGIKRDDEFRKIALENIKAHPKKYLLNCFYNAERLIFDTPYSYYLQSPNIGLKVIMPSIVITFCILCSCMSIAQWPYLFQGTGFFMTLMILYLCLSVAVSAQARHFYVIVPLILIWISQVSRNWKLI